jgi:hypothetical protein
MSEPVIILVTIRQREDGLYEALVEGVEGYAWPELTEPDPTTAAISWLETLAAMLTGPEDFPDENGAAEIVETTMRRVAEFGGEIHFQPRVFLGEQP